MAAAILLLSVIFTGCDDDDKKDNSGLFKNTVWTGEFNYTGTAAQPVSIEFNESGLVTWHELAGDATGAWKIENNKLVVTFPGSIGFNADITGDNKLTHIENLPANKWTLVNGQLNEVVEESLDQTIWTGTNIKLTFKAGDKVDMEVGPTGDSKYPGTSYIHKGKSVFYSVVAGDYKWFIVRDTKTTFKGVNMFSPDPTVYQFQLTKN